MSKPAWCTGRSCERKRLQQLGKSSTRARNVFIRRYQLYADGPDSSFTTDPNLDEEGGDESHIEKYFPHANDHPMMVMVDEETGNTYMRAVENK